MTKMTMKQKLQELRREHASKCPGYLKLDPDEDGYIGWACDFCGSSGLYVPRPSSDDDELASRQAGC